MSADCCGPNLAIICVLGSPANYTCNKQFLLWPIRYKTERGKKISSLQSLVDTFSFSKSLKKLVPWKFYVLTWKPTKERKAKLWSRLWFLTQVTTVDFWQWEGTRGCSDIILQQSLVQTIKAWQTPDPVLGCALETGRIWESVHLLRKLCQGAPACFHLRSCLWWYLVGRGAGN